MSCDHDGCTSTRATLWQGHTYRRTYFRLQIARELTNSALRHLRERRVVPHTRQAVSLCSALLHRNRCLPQPQRFHLAIEQLYYCYCNPDGTL
jgi:hypothetical protein